MKRGSFKNIIIESTPSVGVRVVATNAEGANIIVATSDFTDQVKPAEHLTQPPQPA